MTSVLLGGRPVPGPFVDCGAWALRQAQSAVSNSSSIPTGSLPTSRHSGVGLCDAVRACGIETPVGSRGTASFQRGMTSYHGQLGGEAPVGSCGTDSFLAWNDGLPQAARRHKPDYTCVGPKTRLNNDIKLSLPPRERLGIAGKESPRAYGGSGYAPGGPRPGPGA
uniref:Uncharacterized protein n=1 Tax=Ananas comosus var. bracteatus TaxID=296719 RepID=A0A6V7QA68_ANACO|nr:unnamed protein product [Ananas comosus var. bracteatus]